MLCSLQLFSAVFLWDFSNEIVTLLDISWVVLRAELWIFPVMGLTLGLYCTYSMCCSVELTFELVLWSS